MINCCNALHLAAVYHIVGALTSCAFLQQYLAACSDSVLAVNLKACNTFRLASGREAEAELAAVRAGDAPQHDLVRHNVVVFRGGAHALRDLTPLLAAVPEARLNLVVYHLRRGAVRDAYALIAELEPSLPQVRLLLLRRLEFAQAQCAVVRSGATARAGVRAERCGARGHGAGNGRCRARTQRAAAFPVGRCLSKRM